MNQQKTGEFLKHLRKEKGLTQEQLAEQFYVSSRTVSRWETGSNMPDVRMLIELADFYDEDIREIIDGERKSGIMESMERITEGRQFERETPPSPPMIQYSIAASSFSGSATDFSSIRIV